MSDRTAAAAGTRRGVRVLLRRLDPVNWAAAVWTDRALRRVRRDLPVSGVNAAVRPPPPLPDRGRFGVEAVFRRRRATCLERCLVLQSWLAAHGAEHDLVIGVGRPGEAFAAHAWLVDSPYTQDEESAGYAELMRLPARRRSGPEPV